MNEPLRRAMLHARLGEDDVAAHLGTAAKTVRCWLNGRVPYPHNLRRARVDDMTSGYIGSFERVWADAQPLA